VQVEMCQRMENWLKAVRFNHILPRKEGTTLLGVILGKKRFFRLRIRAFLKEANRRAGQLHATNNLSPCPNL
jgi:hypothetical protein